MLVWLLARESATTQQLSSKRRLCSGRPQAQVVTSLLYPPCEIGLTQSASHLFLHLEDCGEIALLHHLALGEKPTFLSVKSKPNSQQKRSPAGIIVLMGLHSWLWGKKLISCRQVYCTDRFRKIFSQRRFKPLPASLPVLLPVPCSWISLSHLNCASPTPPA